MNARDMIILLLVALVAGLVGAAITAARIRRTEARARRYLDDCAAARVLDLTTRHRS